MPDTGAGLDVALQLSSYDAFFGDTIAEGWMNWVALLDATPAGVVLAVGLAEGLSPAIRLAGWLGDIRERAGA